MTGPASARPAPLPARLHALRRTLVMGVVNVTPDSFSDGGRWFTPGAAVAHGLELLEQGADLLDVGGESTRPGARRVAVDDELARVLPVIEQLVRARCDGERRHDARGGRAGGRRARRRRSSTTCRAGWPTTRCTAWSPGPGAVYVAMHWRGHADVMDDLDDYDDVVTDVRRELAARVAALRAAGVRDEQVVLDPGLGFAKAGSSNWPLLARLPELVADGFPVLVGASRKRFLGHLLAGPDGEPAPPLARDRATAAVSALAAAAGAWCVRVHEVAGSADAVRVAAAWQGVARVRHEPSDEDELAVDEDARTGGSTR